MKEIIAKYLPAVVEGAKEVARIALLAVLPVAIEQLGNGGVNMKTLAIIAMVAVLRFVDKVLHESGKINENPQLLKGLTQF